MFWSAVESINYTCLLLGTAIVLSTYFAPKLGWKRVKTFRWGIFCSMILFVPGIIGINKIITPFRFGVFHYAKFAEIGRHEVSRWVPDKAKDITIEQRIGGFDAMYSIQRSELEDWLDIFWIENGINSQQDRDDTRGFDSPSRKNAEKLGWDFPDDSTVYVGPRASDYAGFTIWFSESKGIAYQDAGYW